MKIVHASINHSPTDDRILFREALSLNKRYENISIIGVGHKEEIQFHDEIKLITILKNNLFNMIANIKTVIKNESPDILHIHDPFLLPIANKFQKSGVKIIYDVHENHYLTFKLFSKRKSFLKNIFASILRLLEKYYSKKVDSIITVTPKLNKYFLQFNPNTYEIRNYPNANTFEKNEDEKLTEEINNFKQNDLLIIYVGQISIKRNLHLAILTTKRLRELNFKIKFLAIGSGEKSDIYFYKFFENNYADFFKLLPEIPHQYIQQVLKQSDIGWAVLPYEDNFLFSFPNKIFEYMSARIPFISSNLYYVKKIADDTNSGIIVEELIADDIAEKIANYILDNKLQQLGENGKKYFESEYNWNSQEVILFEIYSNLF